jgi:GxxExxY protein
MEANGPGISPKPRLLSREVIGCAMDVNSVLGPGFVESVYEKALCIELASKRISFERQKPLTVHYKGQTVGSFLADLVVEGRSLLELKAVAALTDEHVAQVINYLQATGLQVGLLLNFGTPRLGYRRLVWRYDEARPI